MSAGKKIKSNKCGLKSLYAMIAFPILHMSVLIDAIPRRTPITVMIEVYGIPVLALIYLQNYPIIIIRNKNNVTSNAIGSWSACSFSSPP